MGALAGQKPGRHAYVGFLYVDPAAGFTLEYRGLVGLTPEGTMVRQPNELEGKSRLIMRITANLPAACL